MKAVESLLDPLHCQGLKTTQTDEKSITQQPLHSGDKWREVAADNEIFKASTLNMHPLFGYLAGLSFSRKEPMELESSQLAHSCLTDSFLASLWKLFISIPHLPNTLRSSKTQTLLIAVPSFPA